jgi:predicted esterase
MSDQKSSFATSYNITSEYWCRAPKQPKSVYLLLHGFSQRGENIFKKLEAILPVDAIVISPNAPFPSPVKIKEEYKEAYAWYFFLSKEKRFVIHPTEAVKALQNLLVSLHLQDLPIHIIGFSQGGYMGPWMVKHLPQIKSVISIAADYPNHYYEDLRDYKFTIVHGIDDTVAPIQEVRTKVKGLQQKGRKLTFLEVPATGHEINDAVIEKIKTLV